MSDQQTAETSIETNISNGRTNSRRSAGIRKAISVDAAESQPSKLLDQNVTLPLSQRPRRQIKHKYIKSVNSYSNDDGMPLLEQNNCVTTEINEASAVLLRQLSPAKNLNLIPVLRRLSSAGGNHIDEFGQIGERTVSHMIGDNSLIQETNCTEADSNYIQQIADIVDADQNERVLVAGNRIIEKIRTFEARCQNLDNHEYSETTICDSPNNDDKISSLDHVELHLNADPHQCTSDSIIIEENVNVSDCSVDENAIDGCTIEVDASSTNDIDDSENCALVLSKHADELTMDYSVLVNQHSDNVDCGIVLNSKSFNS